MNPVLLVLLSFFASIGFGIVFQIEKRFLFYAGIGGALTRICYLILMHLISIEGAYVMGAAMCAAAYAEFIAPRMKTPSTVFLYPSIIPLIPGDLFYKTMVGIITMSPDEIISNGLKCMICLVWMSIGFVLISSIVHYIRKYRLHKLYQEMLDMPTSEASRKSAESEQVVHQMISEELSRKIASLELDIQDKDNLIQ